MRDRWTLFVAAYAAVVSTLSVLWQVIAFRLSKSVRLDVRLSTTIPASQGRLGDILLSLQVVNMGERVVAITSLILELPNGKLMTYFPEGVPILEAGGPVFHATTPLELAPLKHLQVGMPIIQLARDLTATGLHGKITVRPSAHDQTRKVHIGPKWQFDLDDWSKR